MIRTLLAVTALLLMVSPGGPPAADVADLSDGVLIVHYTPDIQYSSSPPPEGWCGAYDAYAISDCSGQRAQVSVSEDFETICWYVLAAWSEPKEWCGVQFGIEDYDPGAHAFLEAEPCFPPGGGLEIASDQWPGPGEGTALVVSQGSWTGNFEPVYWFASYVYGVPASDVVQLGRDCTAPDSTQWFGGFANCEQPSVEFPIAEGYYGGLGVNTEGVAVCPPAWPQVCCVESECFIVTRADCDGLGGLWHMDWGSCDPNLCFIPEEPEIEGGNWVNPEPWHDWVSNEGDEGVPIQVHIPEHLGEIEHVEFYVSFDLGATWQPIDDDHDSYEPPLSTYDPTVEMIGCGWSTNYVIPDSIPAGPVQFKSIAYPDSGETYEQVSEHLYDPLPPSMGSVSIEDFLVIDRDNLGIEVQANGMEISRIVIHRATMEESFTKGIPGISQQPHSENHCAPTAAAQCLKYFEAAGDTSIAGGQENDGLVEALAAYMSTSDITGTSPSKWVSGIGEWLAHYGEGYTARYFIHYDCAEGGITWTEEDWRRIRNELELCHDVLLAVFWDGGSGGHAMTLNSIYYPALPNGSIVVGFKDPWTGEESTGELDPTTGHIASLTGAGGGNGGQIGLTLIISPTEEEIYAGGPGEPLYDGLPEEGPPYYIEIPIPDPGFWFVHVTIVNDEEHANRLTNIIEYAPPCSLAVTAPNGGEAYCPGDDVLITWHSEGSCGEEVQLDLLHGGEVCASISAATPNDGSFEWTAAPCDTFVEDYTICITDLESAFADTSDAAFTIFAACDPTIIAPNGGERFLVGQMVSITWSSTQCCGENVSLELLREGSVCEVISSSTANDGQFDWSATQCEEATAGYQIRVRDLDTGEYDDSDGTFEVWPPCSMRLIYPNGGEAVTIGDAMELSWDHSGACGADVEIMLLNDDLECLLIAESTPNDGVYDWIAEPCDALVHDYRIRVRDLETDSLDASDGVFSIRPPYQITAIEDVPEDQGGEVRIDWLRCWDDAGGDSSVTSYEIYRRQDRLREEGWDLVATIAASGDSLYRCCAPTVCDSTAQGGICWSVFFVRALTADPQLFHDTPPDSGYSVDNLAPAPPENFHLESPSLLMWNASPEEDLDYYTVYGSEIDMLDSTAVTIGTTTDTTMAITELYPYFHCTATDLAGNEGEAATVSAAGISGGDRLPRTYALYQNSPNPGAPRTAISFDLPRETYVVLRVFDLTGRVLDTLVNETLPAGRHSVTLPRATGGATPVVCGAYFYRIDAGAFHATRKMLIIK